MRINIISVTAIIILFTIEQEIIVHVCGSNEGFFVGMSYGPLEYLQRPEVGTHFKAGILAVWEHKHLMRHHYKHIASAKALTITKRKRKKRSRLSSKHRDHTFACQTLGRIGKGTDWKGRSVDLKNFSTKATVKKIEFSVL